MKKILFILIQIMVVDAFGQALEYDKSITIGSVGMDGLYSLTADEEYIYGTGYFSDTLQFGAHVLHAKGPNDIFVAKMDFDFNPIWIRGFGSHYVGNNTPPGLTENGVAIAVDSGSNIYVTGFFQDTLIAVDTVFDSGEGDAFLLKLTTDGNPTWVRRWGNTGQDRGTSIAIDTKNRVVVTGLHQTYNVPTMLLRRYLPNGDLDLIETNLSRILVTGYDVKTDHDNNIYLAGNFSRQLTIDSITVMAQIDGYSQNAGFVTKLNDQGHVQWIKMFDYIHENDVSSIDVDKEGNIMVLGEFRDTLVTNTTELVSKGGQDVFIMKLDNSGNEIWVKSFGGADFVDPSAVRFLHHSIVFSGTFTGEAAIDDTRLISDFDPGKFMINLNPEGMVKSTFVFGRSSYNRRLGLFARDENVFAAGSFHDNFSIHNDIYTSKGSSDSWLIKLKVGNPLRNTSVHIDKENISVYPNPCQERVYVQSAEEIINVDIIDVNGTVTFPTYAIDTNSIDLSGLKPGIYLLRIQLKHKVVVRKLLKMN